MGSMVMGRPSPRGNCLSGLLQTGPPRLQTSLSLTVLDRRCQRAVSHQYLRAQRTQLTPALRLQEPAPRGGLTERPGHSRVSPGRGASGHCRVTTHGLPWAPLGLPDPHCLVLHCNPTTTTVLKPHSRDRETEAYRPLKSHG